MTDAMKPFDPLLQPRAGRLLPHGQMPLDLVRRAPSALPPRPAVALPEPAVPVTAEELP